MNKNRAALYRQLENPVKGFITERFFLSEAFKRKLRSWKVIFGFNGFGAAVYERTYRRGKERWADTVIRVIEGIFSIRKNHMKVNRLPWVDSDWTSYSEEMAERMFNMEFLPAGRGLFACGTEYVAERGGMALNNCAAVSTEDLVVAAGWSMDALMCGCGVGFDTIFKGPVVRPSKRTRRYKILDSREGWVISVVMLLEAYCPDDSGVVKEFPVFDYSGIRPEGTPIRGFGGTASGPEPLKKLHRRLKAYLDCYLDAREMPACEAIAKMTRILKKDYFENDPSMTEVSFKRMLTAILKNSKKSYGTVRLVTDIMNAIGACVVAGNVRRSSQISFGAPGDEEFLDLKDCNGKWGDEGEDYSTCLNPERRTTAWNSNNSVQFTKTEEFAQHLPKIVSRIKKNGEPGIHNLINAQRFGRVGRYHHKNQWTREYEVDPGIIGNPCNEILLCCFELCNLAEVMPTRCLKNGEFDEATFLRNIEFATFYTASVSLLPTHSELTNPVVARNRRTGVSLTGVAPFYEKYKGAELTRILRGAYRRVREVNSKLAREAGVPESIRVTTIKPGGTVPQLPGVTSGIHFPIESRYVKRRMRVSMDQPIGDFLVAAGVPHEKDVYSDRTWIFEFPIDQGASRSAKDVTLWEQLKILERFQSEFADNQVSATIYYNRETEESDLEGAIASALPHVKGLSVLARASGAYTQPPYEAVTEEEYLVLVRKMPVIDWDSFVGNDGEMPRFCDGEQCEMPAAKKQRTSPERSEEMPVAKKQRRK